MYVARTFVPSPPPRPLHLQRMPDHGKRKHVVKAFRPDGIIPEQEDDLVSATGNIRCPACSWQPKSNSRWFCMSMGPPENFTAGCGNGWNTFDTRGVCSGCKYQWKHTTCLDCSVTSLHDDWYVGGSAAGGP